MDRYKPTELDTCGVRFETHCAEFGRERYSEVKKTGSNVGADTPMMKLDHHSTKRTNDHKWNVLEFQKALVITTAFGCGAQALVNDKERKLSSDFPTCLRQEVKVAKWNACRSDWVVMDLQGVDERRTTSKNEVNLQLIINAPILDHRGEDKGMKRSQQTILVHTLHPKPPLPSVASNGDTCLVHTCMS